MVCHGKSPSGYRLIRESGVLVLPSRSTLKRYIGACTGQGVSSLIKKRLHVEAKLHNEQVKHELCSNEHTMFLLILSGMLRISCRGRDVHKGSNDISKALWHCSWFGKPWGCRRLWPGEIAGNTSSVLCLCGLVTHYRYVHSCVNSTSLKACISYKTVIFFTGVLWDTILLKLWMVNSFVC